MTISRIDLQAHIQRQQGTDTEFTNINGIDSVDTDRMSFIDWLTELDVVPSNNPNTTISPVTDSPQIQTELNISERQSKDFKAKATEPPVSTESPDDDPSIDPKQIVHLLHEALTPADILYLKQWLIPHLPIALGTIPIQQVFPNTESGEISYRSFEISDNLKQLVQKGVKTGAPIRIELDPNASVVLKFRNGRVSAEFLANDNVSAWLVKQQLETLKQQLLSKQLPVDDVTYRQQQKRQRPFLFQEKDKQNPS